jgi:Mrp family chromosome partitioning ATPase
MNKVISAISASAKRSDGSGESEPETMRGPKPTVWTGRERVTAAQRPGAEPYDALLWRLQARQSADSNEGMTLGITACERRAGTTTVAASLALRAAELQLGPVLLVEANRRGSWLSKKWRLNEGPGLAQLLASEANYVDCLQAGPAPQLEVITAGPVDRGEVGLLEPGSVEAMLAEACADHRIVLFDLPAADELNQMLLVAKQLDQVLMVVRSDSTRKGDAERFGEQLLDDGAPLAGIVLNRQRNYIPRFLRRWL